MPPEVEDVRCEEAAAGAGEEEPDAAAVRPVLPLSFMFTAARTASLLALGSKPRVLCCYWSVKHLV